MITVKNQRVVKIELEQVQKKPNRPYVCLYNDTLDEALKSFNTIGEIKLYLYLCQNQNGWELAFSPQNVQEIVGISDNTARAAFKTLQDKGYITLKKGNKYTFNNKSVFIGKRWIQREDGKAEAKTWSELLKIFDNNVELAQKMWLKAAVCPEE